MKKTRINFIALIETNRPMLDWNVEMIGVVKTHSDFMLEQSRTMEGPIKAVVQAAALSSMRDVQLEMALRN
jgi:hypothetical protein